MFEFYEVESIKLRIISKKGHKLFLQIIFTGYINYFESNNK